MDSAANIVQGKQFYRVIFAKLWLLILGMRNLNDLQAKDLAKDEAAEDDSEATVDLSPNKEVAQALEEVAALEAILKELDVVYKTSLYIRIGCLSHKVSLYSGHRLFLYMTIVLIIRTSFLAAPMHMTPK